MLNVPRIWGIHLKRREVVMMNQSKTLFAKQQAFKKFPSKFLNVALLEDCEILTL